jgi:hypothetical protein
MDPDDVAYRRSVRNTVVVLAVVVVVLAASIALTLLFDVTPNTFQTKTSVASTQPLTLTLEVNTTSGAANRGVEISAWLNGTSTGNVTANSNWAFDQTKLVYPVCSSGFPLGVGVMQGHYTSDNYSLGTLVSFVLPKQLCPHEQAPAWFYFASATSRVLVTIGATPVFWVLRVNATVSSASLGVSRLAPGVYTAVAADEWGDFVLTNFRIS